MLELITTKFVLLTLVGAAAAATLLDLGRATRNPRRRELMAARGRRLRVGIALSVVAAPLFLGAMLVPAVPDGAYAVAGAAAVAGLAVVASTTWTHWVSPR